ncbi:hypothetical protein [Candidatus Burkholderia verschuerenii]|uniref:hypothetical protein n=1 Tax=Candidatus Burkholderia verschuerenii TaxID=242163 RepID=UPI000B2BEE9B|nr:hypothetical protein [Candidatus Burkholderia verschuerenii]
MTDGADRTGGPRRVRPPTASEQLEELLGYRVQMGRPPKHDLGTWTVTDDWPDPVPVTDAEIEVFDRWFGDLLMNCSAPPLEGNVRVEIELENGTIK